MNPNKLNQLLELAKNEEINTKCLDYKTRCLMNNISHEYISYKSAMITAVGLFAIISILSSYNIQNKQQIALKALEENRSTIVGTEYIYDTILASYQSYNEE